MIAGFLTSPGSFIRPCVYLHVADEVSSGFAAMVGYETVRIYRRERAEVKQYTQAYNPDCPTTITYTWDHLSYEGDATGEWKCCPEGAGLGVSAGSKKPWRKVITNSYNTNVLGSNKETFDLTLTPQP